MDNEPCDHSLKTWSRYFKEVVAGRKRFEIRNDDDRDFRVGQRVILRDYMPRAKRYTGKRAIVKILYLTNFGQPKGQVVWSFELLEVRN